LTVALWFVGNPAAADAADDQLLDEFDIGPFPASGVLAPQPHCFAFSFTSAAPDITKIPDFAAMDISALLIRIRAGAVHVLLIPFYVTVDHTAQGARRRLIAQPARPAAIHSRLLDSSAPASSTDPASAAPPPAAAAPLAPAAAALLAPAASARSALPTANPVASPASVTTATATTTTPSEEGHRGVAICAVQLDSLDCRQARDRDENLRRATRLIERAHLEHGQARQAQGWAVLYVLPELSSTGYHPATFGQLAVLAEADENGPSAVAFRALARQLQAYICFGLPRRHADGYSISQAVVSVR
jgi:hypothetical protein